MTRRLEWTVRFEGTLHADSPIHIGGAVSETGIDLSLARNGAGDIVIPATSLAGLLRSIAADLDVAYEGDHLSAKHGALSPTRRLFGEGSNRGSESPDTPDAAKVPGASLIAVSDGVLQPTWPVKGGFKVPAIEVRDHVRINRDTGAAADGAKYDRQVIPAGAEFAFWCELDVPSSMWPQAGTPSAEDLLNVEFVDLLCRTLGELVQGRSIGASTTSGLGRLRLVADSITAVAHRIGCREGILAQLAGDAGADTAAITAAIAQQARLAASERRQIVLGWEALTPVLVTAAAKGDAIDHFPLMTAAADGKLVPVLPGSSIKGVLRTAAERIVNTVVGRVINFQTVDSGEAAYPIWALFGAPRDEKLVNQRLGRGALTVGECTAAAPQVERAQWAKVVNARKRSAKNNDAVEPVVQILHDAGLAEWRVATHVAIDRWTGGANDGKLFTELEPLGCRVARHRTAARRVSVQRHGREAVACLPCRVGAHVGGVRRRMDPIWSRRHSRPRRNPACFGRRR
jgi:CRISPR/Cas system CSM-associated protein Csm3 (group 7 of RAMP superfamily)